MKNKTYLGDSVYAEAKEHEIVLTTDNGEGPTNEIILEPFVILALVEFLHEHGMLPVIK
jgi:hypothetical protein